MEPTKITVNLTGRTVASLAKAMALKEETKTETVNRAIQLYAMLESHWAEGGSVLLESSDGKPTYFKMY